MAFEVGKYYKHTTGYMLHTLFTVETMMYGFSLIAEESGTGAFRPLGTDEDSATNWVEINKKEWNDYHNIDNSKDVDVISIEKIKIARQIFKEAFERDPNFRYAYLANVACALIDEYEDYNKDNRESIANKILKILFDVEGLKEKEVEEGESYSRFEIMDI